MPLPEQDRARWNHGQIVEASGILRGALASGRPGAFQLEAAISAVHCEARTPDVTDWAQIAELYRLLEGHRRGPQVRINRAFAVARVEGAEAGLALLDGIANDEPYVAVVRGVLHAEAGRVVEALTELERARATARNVDEVAQIDAHIERVKRGCPS